MFSINKYSVGIKSYINFHPKTNFANMYEKKDTAIEKDVTQVTYKK